MLPHANQPKVFATTATVRHIAVLPVTDIITQLKRSSLPHYYATRVILPFPPLTNLPPPRVRPTLPRATFAYGKIAKVWLLIRYQFRTQTLTRPSQKVGYVALIVNGNYLAIYMAKCI